jgi:hypothetical protein
MFWGLLGLRNNAKISCHKCLSRRRKLENSAVKNACAHAPYISLRARRSLVLGSVSKIHARAGSRVFACERAGLSLNSVRYFGHNFHHMYSIDLIQNELES